MPNKRKKNYYIELASLEFPFVSFWSLAFMLTALDFHPHFLLISFLLLFFFFSSYSLGKCLGHLTALIWWCDVIVVDSYQFIIYLYSFRLPSSFILFGLIDLVVFFSVAWIFVFFIFFFFFCNLNNFLGFLLIFFLSFPWSFLQSSVCMCALLFQSIKTDPQTWPMRSQFAPKCVCIA